MDTAPGPDPGDAESEHGDTVASEAGAPPSDPPEPTATDPLEPTDEELGPHDPLRFNHWMKRSAAGAVLSGIALGLQQALEPKRELPAFVMEAPGEPEDPDAPITLHFDPDDPTKTVAVIRTLATTEHADPKDGPGTGP